MANKKKALRASPFDDAEIEASIFGGSQIPAGPGRVAKKQSSKVAIEQKGNETSWKGEKEPLEKIAMRLPRSLATEFQQVYLQLAAWHLKTYGRKLHIQDCHIEAMRDWIEKQKKRFVSSA